MYIVNVNAGISYSSTSLFERLGIRPLPFGTCISAYMKMWAQISSGKSTQELV